MIFRKVKCYDTYEKDFYGYLMHDTCVEDPYFSVFVPKGSTENTTNFHAFCIGLFVKPDLIKLKDTCSFTFDNELTRYIQDQISSNQKELARVEKQLRELTELVLPLRQVNGY